MVLLLGLTATAARAQEQRFRERQVLDPQTGEWVDQARPPGQVPGDELDQARALLVKKKPAEARTLLTKWLKQNPDHERHYEGEYLLGESYFLLRDFWKAVEHYQRVAENSSGELFQLANARCVDVARAFMSGQKRILWGLFPLPAYDEGVSILDRVWERMPGTRLGEVALRLKGDFHFERGDVDLAQDEYANLAQQYPSGRWTQYAMLRTAAAAEAAFAGVKFDDHPLIEAAEKYRQMQGTFPAYAEHENVTQRLDGIRQQRAEKDLDIARWYERTTKLGAAEYYYRLILKDWPDTLAAAEARSRLRALGVTVEEPAATTGSEGS